MGFALLDIRGDLARWVRAPTHPGGFRLFLAMLVFVHHFSSFGLGGFAVYEFFILSGFWLQQMWSDRYIRTRNPYLTYLVSRVWRLAPAMILVSVISFLLLPLFGMPTDRIYSSNPVHLALSSIVLLGYAWLPYLPIGSAWSLDVEMQFYLIAPLLALIGVRGWGVTLLIFAILCSLGFSMLHIPPTFMKYIVFFMVGMTASRVRWRPSRKLASTSAGAVILSVLVVLVSPWRDVLIGGAHPGPLHAYNAFYNVVLALLAVPYALFTTARESDALDRMMADLSYIIYLLHWVAMQWFFQFTGPFMVRLEVAATSFVVVPAASWVIWYYYEKPINRRRARWVSDRIKRTDNKEDTYSEKASALLASEGGISDTLRIEPAV